MLVMWAIVIVFGAGCLGGLSNAFMSGSLELPSRDKDANAYRPGWVGNVLVGGIAAIVFWGLYGPFANLIVLSAEDSAADITLKIGEVAGSLVTGIGGGRILTNEVDKRNLKNANNKLGDSLAMMVPKD